MSKRGVREVTEWPLGSVVGSIYACENGEMGYFEKMRQVQEFEHDGTAAIVYGMRQPRVSAGGFDGGNVVIFDWDVRSLALGGRRRLAAAR